MSRIRKSSLRQLIEQEQKLLEQLVHASSERADVVTWARELLAVASGQTYAQAAAMGGRCSNEAVSELVARFNRDRLAPREPHGNRGPKPIYGAAAREWILAEARRTPDPERDATATWSLMTLHNALRRALTSFPISARTQLTRYCMRPDFAGRPRAASVTQVKPYACAAAAL